MVAPDIARVDAYTGQGKVEFVWYETFADYLNPTRAELDAGVTLTPVVCGRDGWTSEPTQIPTPNARDTEESSITGKRTYAQSQLTTYIAEEGTDSRDLMAEGDKGYIGQYPSGDVAGRKLDIFPVEVATMALQISINGEDPDTAQFTYNIKGRPYRGVAPAQAGP